MLIFQFFQALLFIGTVELVAFSSLPLVVKFFPWSLGYSFSLSRIFGQFLFASLLWAATASGLLPLNLYTIVSILVFVFVIGLLINKDFIKSLYAEDLFVHLGFYFVLSFFLFFRFLHPEIHWGEKPMDFTFLNYFTNLNTMPPMEPWASGFAMRYYYGGFFLNSSLLKLSHVNADVGYNLIVSTIPALYFIGLYSVFRALCVNSRLCIVFSLLVLFSSSAEMLIGIISGREIDSHLFWASTRVYTSPGFTEYPFWTFLFADLHPHMMAMPFVLLFVYVLIEAAKRNFSFLHQVVLSMLLAFLVLTNAWDAIVCSLLLAFFWLVVHFSKRLNWRIISDSIVFAFILFVFCLPVYLSIKTNSAQSLMWATDIEFNSFLKLSRIFGFWFFLVATLFLTSIKSKLSKSSLVAVFITFVAMTASIVASRYFTQVNLPIDIIFYLSLLILACVFVDYGEYNRNTLILLLFSLLLLVVVELVVVIDRMNSIFKFHFFIWTSLGISILSSLNLLARTKFEKYKNIVLLLLFAIIAITPSGFSLAIAHKGFHWNLQGVGREINGFNYFSDYNLKDYKIISWLRKQAKPNSIIVEAYGPSYQDFARISKNTGLVSVLGWDFHVSQRDVPGHEIEKRKQILNIIYSSDNSKVVCELLNNYNVSYLVVSDLERKQYKMNSSSLLESLSCLEKKYSFQDAIILERIQTKP